MNKIHILDNTMINKIAAGEVVERPVSVVKELTENALDAHASQITIEIKDGGLSYIRITDNGVGIAHEQIETAFLRHATSKIETMHDLERVMTMGFRGEALSSIAAVSQVEMVTKTPEAIAGTRIEINGGIVEDQHEAGVPNGTTILVRNLFFNTPVRRKFLKKPATESGYITDLLHKLAIGRPDISFTYINNDSLLLQTKGNGDLRTAALQIYGKDAVKQLLTLEYKQDIYYLHGLVGKPSLSRGNRSYEHFYINGRYVKSELIQSAVEEAYKTRLPIGKFPFFILKLAMNPQLVDVNVHPAKLAVRFQDEDAIYQLMQNALHQLFEKQNLMTTVQWKSERKAPAQTSFSENQLAQQSAPEAKHASPKNILPRMAKVHLPTTEIYQKNQPISVRESPAEEIYRSSSDPVLPEPISPVKTIEQTEPAQRPLTRDYQIIGQVFATYWIVQQGESLYLIDQHAAHERQIYEELLKKMKTSNIHSQPLLEPFILQQGFVHMDTVKKNWDLLKSFGFDLEDFAGQYLLRAVPYVFQEPENIDFFIEMIDRLSDIQTSVENVYETKLHIIATASCKAAVKGNNKLSYQEARTLIDHLMQLENPFTCPHGRPTIVEMTRHDLEKKFKRIM